MIMLCTCLICYETLVPPFVLEEDEEIQELDSKLRSFVKTSWEFLKRKKEQVIAFFQKHSPSWLKKRPYLLLILLLVLTIFFADFFVPLQFEQTEVIVVGHRGSLVGVENTLEAVESAVQQGADFVEIDILLSKDGVPMVIHDYNLNRLSGSKQYVYDLTAEELGEITLRDRGYTGKISTLEELCIYTKGRIKLLIEFKTHGKEEKSVIEESVQIVRRSGMQQDVQYQTTLRGLLLEANIKYPEIEMGYIIAGHLGKLSPRKILGLGADFLGVEESFATSKLVKSCHRAGLPIYVWTVNNETAAAEFADLKVDGIITDYPELVVTALLEHKEMEEITNS